MQTRHHELTSTNARTLRPLRERTRATAHNNKTAARNNNGEGTIARALREESQRARRPERRRPESPQALRKTPPTARNAQKPARQIVQNLHTTNRRLKQDGRPKGGTSRCIAHAALTSPRPTEQCSQGYITASARPRHPRWRHLGQLGRLRPPTRPDVRGNSYNYLPIWTPAPRRVNPEPPEAIHIGRAPRARATTCAEECAGVLVRAAAAAHPTSPTRICAWPCRRRQTLRRVVANLPPAPRARLSPERPFACARTAQRASHARSATRGRCPACVQHRQEASAQGQTQGRRPGNDCQADSLVGPS